MTLLEKCNADVFKAILDIKERDQMIGKKLLAILQKHELPDDMTCEEMLWFSAYLPDKIWNNKVYNFFLLFQCEQTTEMP